MRTAIFSLLLLAAPGLLGQSSVPFAASPGAPVPSHSGKLTAIAPQGQDFSIQPNGRWRGPLLAENRPFAFARPSPPALAGKMEPIPTQWPNAKFEAIPTRWKNLKVAQARGGGAPADTGSAARFAQPGRK
ncbi:MAG TPA: hypothetical protein VMD92_04750 [Acidobacteriaceae bacterium]|nr:hypothetical protein [Acidobacteriaceae bacterium]